MERTRSSTSELVKRSLVSMRDILTIVEEFINVFTLDIIAGGDDLLEDLDLLSRTITEIKSILDGLDTNLSE